MRLDTMSTRRNWLARNSRSLRPAAQQPQSKNKIKIPPRKLQIVSKAINRSRMRSFDILTSHQIQVRLSGRVIPSQISTLNPRVSVVHDENVHPPRFHLTKAKIGSSTHHNSETPYSKFSASLMTKPRDHRRLPG